MIKFLQKGMIFLSVYPGINVKKKERGNLPPLFLDQIKNILILL